jgi:hypothetical protein
MSLAGQLTFERAAGNMPAVKSMWKDPALKQKLHWDQFIAALRYGHPGIPIRTTRCTQETCFSRASLTLKA